MNNNEDTFWEEYGIGPEELDQFVVPFVEECAGTLDDLHKLHTDVYSDVMEVESDVDVRKKILGNFYFTWSVFLVFCQINLC